MIAYSTTFTVYGNGEFPVDLLRIDACFPLTIHDYLAADPDRIVKMQKIHTGIDPHISLDAWITAGWPIDLSTLRTSKA